MVAAGGKPQNVEVWPENWPVFELFCTVRTQWRVGFGGPIGLDYSAVYPLIDRMTDDKDEWAQILRDLQCMEFAALAAMKTDDK